MASPRRHSIRSRTSIRGYLPLNDDQGDGIAPREPRLHALMHTFSNQPMPSPRHRSTFQWVTTEDVEAQRGSNELERCITEDDRVGLAPLDRRMSEAAKILLTPEMRSQRLIGNSNPRYKWERYYKTEEELKGMKKPIRQYYERNNFLIQQYCYIDRLLDSSLPHDLIQEYNEPQHVSLQRASSRINIPSTIKELSGTGTPPMSIPHSQSMGSLEGSASLMSESAENGDASLSKPKVKRTPKNLYRLPNEETPLLKVDAEDGEEELPLMPPYEPEDDADSGAPVVTFAIYLNLVANTILLILKIIVTVLTSSISVLASLVDAALDFLSTAIVWTTTQLISQKDAQHYPVGRRKLEPIGVLVFSVIMITSFFQVALEGFQKLNSGDHTVVELSVPAVAIMASTVVVKFGCWLWCRLIKNSSVQALAQDAMTDVVFNIFSIIFPLVGFYAKVWWLDPLGGILLSFYVIFSWSRTTTVHIRNLTGAAASADERNVLLYLCMRFAWTIRKIQSINAYHSGDCLNVEVDIVLDENTSLRDSHDLGESLQYVLESIPIVDRAFVHLDYASYNIPSHMQQQE